jgi:drug/metabolite transporter (DMT)-like permease
MLVFSALVAGSFSFGTRIANDIDPMALTAARFLIATCLLGGLVIVFRRPDQTAWNAPWRYAVLGFLFAGYFVLMFWGLRTAPPVSAAAVFTLTPVMSAGFGWIILGQRMTPKIAAALAIGALGALWVIFRADLSAFLAFDLGRGEAIYFVGCVSHALYAPLVTKLNRGEPALVFTFGMLVAGFLFLAVTGAPAILATAWGDLPPRVWWGLAYLAIFASAASFVLLQVAALRLPAAKVMAYTYLTPTWVIGWEIILGAAVPSSLILIGVALSAVALLLLLREGTSLD